MLLTRDLEGTKKFWGDHDKNKTTSKQDTIIQFIHQELNVLFDGGGSKSAYQFIGAYYKLAKRNAVLAGREYPSLYK